MPFSNDTLAKAAFKKFLGKAHTSNSKQLQNEAYGSDLIGLASSVFADDIAAIPADAISDGVSTTLTTLTLEEDISSDGYAYLVKIATVSGSPLDGVTNPLTASPYVDGDRVVHLISPKNGDLYRAILKESGSEISPLSSHDWYLDYDSGIIFSEAPLSLSSGTLDAYIYKGRYLNNLSDLVDSGRIFFKNGVDGYSLLSGNLGIGTNTPADKLHIASSATGGLTIDNTSTGDPVVKLSIGGTTKVVLGADNSDSDKFKIEYGSSLGSGNHFVLDSSGNLCFGGSVPISSSKLSVYGATSFAGDLLAAADGYKIGRSVTDYLQWNSAGNGSLNAHGSFVVNIDSDNNGSNNGFYVGHNTDGYSLSNILLSVLEDGYVGIGTTSPEFKLVVSGGSAGGLSSFKNNGILIKSTNTVVDGEAALSWQNLGPANDPTKYWTAGINENLTGLSFAYGPNFTDEDTKVYFATDGKVGVGTFAPDFKMVVTGSSSGNSFKANGLVIRASNAVTDGEAAISWQNLGPSHTAGNYWIQGINETNTGLSIAYGTTLSSANTKMHIATDGSVGIGLTAPLYDLHVGSSGVSATSTAQKKIVVSNGTNSQRASFVAIANDSGGAPVEINVEAAGNSQQMIIGTITSHEIAIRTANLPRMTILETGEIGIGDTTPTASLEITNGSSARSPLIVRENNTVILEFADNTTAPTESNSLLIGNSSGIATWSNVRDFVKNTAESSFVNVEDFVFATDSSNLADGTVIGSYEVKNVSSAVDPRTTNTIIANHPGVIDLTVHHLSDHAGLVMGPGSSFTVETGQKITLVGYVNIADLSDGTDDYKFVWGVVSSSTGDASSIGSKYATIQYDLAGALSSSWIVSAHNGTSSGGGDTSISVTTGWHRFELSWTGGTSGISFRIDNSSTFTASITPPTGTLYATAGLISKVTGSSADKTVEVDYQYISISGITRG